jgi:hypothetical protein
MRQLTHELASEAATIAMAPRSNLIYQMHQLAHELTHELALSLLFAPCPLYVRHRLVVAVKFSSILADFLFLLPWLFYYLQSSQRVLVHNAC